MKYSHSLSSPLLPLRSSWISLWMLVSQRARRSYIPLKTAARPQPSCTMQCPHRKGYEQPGAGYSDEHVLVPVHAAGWCAPSLPWASLPPTLSSGSQPGRTAEEGHKGAVICNSVPYFSVQPWPEISKCCLGQDQGIWVMLK